MRQVTRRYASNLLSKGKNSEFTIGNLKRTYTTIDNIVVGYYFFVEIGGANYQTKDAAGATPLQAVERCLEKHGVHFR